MPKPVDLLLITWNRREYLEKTLAHLFEDPADFRLYCWDNGSQDGAADLIASLKDSRVVEKHLHQENVKQNEPTFWFLDRAASDVVGKIDDDVLLPKGWTERIAPMVRSDGRFGMLGCCLFMPDEWDQEAAARNSVTVGGYKILRAMGIAGQAFLCRKGYVKHYADRGVQHGFPIDRLQMTLDGLVAGYPLPELFAHNMDHPRSPLNIYSTRERWGSEHMSASCRFLNVKSIDVCIAGMREDARRITHVPFESQLRGALNDRYQAQLPRYRRRLARMLNRFMPF